MRPTVLPWLLLLAGLVAGCPNKTHCQSGAQHGTTCYDQESGYQREIDSGDQAPPSTEQKRPPATAPRWK